MNRFGSRWEALGTRAFNSREEVRSEFMKTRVIQVDPAEPDPRAVEEAAAVLRGGGLVAFPTETVYGLGANALDRDAVAGIFRAKGRPADNPLIVHVSRPEMLSTLVTSVPPSAEKMIFRFWPGPLTLLFPKSAAVPDIVTAGLPQVAIRMPDHPVAHLLIDAAQIPVAAPSANVSGRPSPTSASDVLEDLDGKIDVVLDGGPCEIGVESTVLDLSGTVPRILRPGGIPREEIAEALGVPVEVVSAEGEIEGSSPSPGMKYRHYAPKGEMYLLTGRPEEQRDTAIQRAQEVLKDGKGVAVLSSSENVPAYLGLKEKFPGLFHVLELGPRSDPAKIASKLFSSIRRADKLGVSVILSESFDEAGLGLAIANRLTKASGGKVLPPRSARPLTVLFVCTGNTCRSPMAEALFKKIWEDRGGPGGVRVFSRGTGALPGMPAAPEARAVMKKRGVDISGHVSMPLLPVDVESSDIIVAMTKAHKEAILSRFPAAEGKIFTLAELASEVVPGDIPDPLGRGEEAYEETAALLEKAFELVAPRLLKHPALRKEDGDRSASG